MASRNDKMENTNPNVRAALDHYFPPPQHPVKEQTQAGQTTESMKDRTTGVYMHGGTYIPSANNAVNRRTGREIDAQLGPLLQRESKR
ncbi:hypothetical protein FRB99_004661, partial [Tulasnella sp. 403]